MLIGLVRVILILVHRLSAIMAIAGSIWVLAFVILRVLGMLTVSWYIVLLPPTLIALVLICTAVLFDKGLLCFKEHE